MKRKILILFILAGLACLPLKALAYEKNFPAGSIIIPMDAFYQPVDDMGHLETYGLAYYLLSHQDQACVAAAGGNAQKAAECEHTISLSWVINDLKEIITGTDVVIEDTTLPRTEDGVTIDAVVREYDHAGGTKALTFDTANGDSIQRITYVGSAFIVDVQDLAPGVEDEVYAIINGDAWDAVNVHVAQVPFAAPVYREMRGTPPRIALMNNDEDKSKGNASILESYLRLAGICSDIYDVVTPNEIAGLSSDLSGAKIDPILGPKGPGYDFLWAPHWDSTKNYDGSGGYAKADAVVKKIKEYLKTGKGLLGECASIETFEHSEEGRFLSDEGFGHNGGTNNGADIIYNYVSASYTQIGNVPPLFEPEGGHLHNWRPFQIGDDYKLDPAPDKNASYNPTVKRFTVDNTGWDYFVGGHAYGNTDYGYVVYLGGHSYADCKDDKVEDTKLEVAPEHNVHEMTLEFTKDSKGADFTIDVDYTINPFGALTTSASFAKDDLTAKTAAWDPASLSGLPLQIDFTPATVDDKGKKFQNILFKNTFHVEPLEIETITLSWAGGSSDLKIKKLIDEKTDVKHYDEKAGSASVFTLNLDPDAFVIDGLPPAAGGGGSGSVSVGCTANSGCTTKNVAGVRYVLNTLFSIKYEVRSYEYVRSAPIVKHPWLYQGSFEHPSYAGHFRRYHVEATEQNADWDTALGSHIAEADSGNSNGRKVYTASYDDVTGDWSRTDFDASNVAALVADLAIEPADNGTADEIKVIERLRGRLYDEGAAEYDEKYGNKLGGIMHSAPVIVRAGDSRVGGSRDETAYVGDLYGMLHAIDTISGNEKWAFIPRNLLGRLKNDRTDPNADPLFAAVDGSPTALDLFYDHDDDGDKEWRTILVCAEGFGGNSIFALDVTDPDNFDVLWEAADDPSVDGLAPGGGLGYAFRTSIDKVKAPVLDINGNPTYDFYGNPVYEVKWMVFVATSFFNVAEDHGGINVFAFDLKTGAEQWTFSSTYADSVNDIPGAVTTYDIDDDSFADRLYVGDMNGRMWELALSDDPDGNWTAGESVHTAEVTDESAFGGTSTKAIPLFNAGFGNPISVSPAVVTRNGHVMLIFGTGGADWASNDKGYHLFAVDVTAAGPDLMRQSEKDRNYAKLGGAIDAVWSLSTAKGEKIWSSPTITAGQIWLVTSFGSMESADPRNDKLGKSVLRALDLDGVVAVGTPLLINSKIRGSIYVSNRHLYMTTIDNQIIQIGDGDHTAGTGNRVVLKSWQHQTDAAGTTTYDDSQGWETTIDQGDIDGSPPETSPVN